MTAVGQAVLGGVALGLGIDRDWFARHLTADPTVLFRVFHYPPGDTASWGVGEHTDYGLITLLAQDPHGGLQVRSGDQWLDVPADPYVFVVNIGDMLERMTGGVYRSNPHRVRNLSGADRLSFPLFLDPSWTRRSRRCLRQLCSPRRTTTPPVVGTGRACTPGTASTATTSRRRSPRCSPTWLRRFAEAVPPATKAPATAGRLPWHSWHRSDRAQQARDTRPDLIWSASGALPQRGPSSGRVEPA